MAITWAYSLGSVVIISLLAFVGIFTLSLDRGYLRKILFVLISFSVGALFGDVFLHLLPEIEEAGGGTKSMVYIFLGFMAFFVLEKLLRWHHYHHSGPDDDPSESLHHDLTHIGYLNLVSDGLHNFIDGAVIAGSFLVSVPVGISTAVAVFLHEIPQEIGDFGLLLHSGFSRRKALFFNFCSGLIAVLGVAAVLLGFKHSPGLTDLLLPLSAGGFLYVAGSDLVPELHKIEGSGKSLIQLLAICTGFGLMALLLLLE